MKTINSFFLILTSFVMVSASVSADVIRMGPAVTIADGDLTEVYFDSSAKDTGPGGDQVDLVLKASVQFGFSDPERNFDHFEGVLTIVYEIDRNDYEPTACSIVMNNWDSHSVMEALARSANLSEIELDHEYTLYDRETLSAERSDSASLNDPELFMYVAKQYIKHGGISAEEWPFVDFATKLFAKRSR